MTSNLHCAVCNASYTNGPRIMQTICWGVSNFNVSASSIFLINTPAHNNAMLRVAAVSHASGGCCKSCFGWLLQVGILPFQLSLSNSRHWTTLTKQNFQRYLRACLGHM